MHTYSNPVKSIGCIHVLLLLLVVFPLPSVTPVHAGDGDFVWSKAIGSGEVDQGHSVTIDASGNVYTTGYFNGTVDFDPGPGTFNLTSAGTNDIFISKLDSNGNFVWAKAITDYYSCIAYDIVTDSSGNVYLTGFFWDTVDFDPGPGTTNLTSNGWSDIFIIKLTSSGNLLWAKAMGGTQYDNGFSLSVDSSGNVYVTGYFQGTADFDPGPGTVNLISAGNLDIFICKLDSNGNLLWAKGMGGTLEDRGYSIATDNFGNVYATGFFQETVDFNPGGVGGNLINTSGLDIFVSKFSSNGDFVWAKGMGGTLGGEGGEGLALSLDTSGNAYTTGYFTGTVDFDPGAGNFNLSSEAPSQDIFISKLSSNGNFVWAKSLHGPLNENGYGIAVESSGNVYTTGFFQGTVDFDPGTGTFNLTSVGVNDIFISKLSSNGNFVWAKSMGGTLNEYGKDITIDSSKNVYTTGYFQGTGDFDPEKGIFNMTSAGSDDIFIHKLSGSSFPWPMFTPAITGRPLQ